MYKSINATLPNNTDSHEENRNDNDLDESYQQLSNWMENHKPIHYKNVNIESLEKYYDSIKTLIKNYEKEMKKLINTNIAKRKIELENMDSIYTQFIPYWKMYTYSDKLKIHDRIKKVSPEGNIKFKKNATVYRCRKCGALAPDQYLFCVCKECDWEEYHETMQ